MYAVLMWGEGWKVAAAKQADDECSQHVSGVSFQPSRSLEPAHARRHRLSRTLRLIFNMPCALWLQVRDGCKPLLFDLREPGVRLWSKGHEEEISADVPPIQQQLDAAMEDAKSRGIPVRALLLAQPNNPTGTV